MPNKFKHVAFRRSRFSKSYTSMVAGGKTVWDEEGKNALQPVLQRSYGWEEQSRCIAALTRNISISLAESNHTNEIVESGRAPVISGSIFVSCIVSFLARCMTPPILNYDESSVDVSRARELSTYTVG